MATIASTRFGGKLVAQSLSGAGAGLTDIKRNAIEDGTANHIIVNNGSGKLSSVAVLGASRGGTGVDTSGSTGVARVTAGTWTAGKIFDADIDAFADISRSKLAGGSSDHIVVNASDGSLTDVATLDPARGGTGINSSASSGVALVSAGAWTVGQIVDSDIAGPISRAKLANGTPSGVVINSAGGQMTDEAVLAVQRGGLGADFSGTGPGPFVAQLNSGVFTNVAAGDSAAPNTYALRDGSGGIAFTTVDTSEITAPGALNVTPSGALNIDADGIFFGDSDTTTTPSGILGGLARVFVRNVQTTDATATTLLTLPTSAGAGQGTTYFVQVATTCGDVTGGASSASISFVLRAKNVGGTLTKTTDQQKLRLRDAPLASVDATAVISGANLLIRVSGVAATTVWWAGRIVVTQQEF